MNFKSPGFHVHTSSEFRCSNPTNFQRLTIGRDGNERAVDSVTSSCGRERTGCSAPEHMEERLEQERLVFLRISTLVAKFVYFFVFVSCRYFVFVSYSYLVDTFFFVLVLQFSFMNRSDTFNYIYFSSFLSHSSRFILSFESKVSLKWWWVLVFNQF